MTTELTRLLWFVPMRPINPLNAREHPQAMARRARQEQDATAATLYRALRARGMTLRAMPEAPKRIRFTVHVSRRFDEGDNLPAVVKHVRDALIGLRVIHADGPTSGHTFEYAQVISGPPGVEIAVELADGMAGEA